MLFFLLIYNYHKILVAARTAAIAYASQEPMRFLVKRAHASYTIAIPLVMLSCIQHANLAKTLAVIRHSLL